MRSGPRGDGLYWTSETVVYAIELWVRRMGACRPPATGTAPETTIRRARRCSASSVGGTRRSGRRDTESAALARTGAATASTCATSAAGSSRSRTRAPTGDRVRSRFSARRYAPAVISKEPFGSTGHESTRTLFGAASLGSVSQADSGPGARNAARARREPHRHRGFLRRLGAPAGAVACAGPGRLLPRHEDRVSATTRARARRSAARSTGWVSTGST